MDIIEEKPYITVFLLYLFVENREIFKEKEKEFKKTVDLYIQRQYYSKSQLVQKTNRQNTLKKVFKKQLTNYLVDVILNKSLKGDTEPRQLNSVRNFELS